MTSNASSLLQHKTMNKSIILMQNHKNRWRFKSYLILPIKTLLFSASGWCLLDTSEMMSCLIPISYSIGRTVCIVMGVIPIVMFSSNICPSRVAAMAIMNDLRHLITTQSQNGMPLSSWINRRNQRVILRKEKTHVRSDEDRCIVCPKLLVLRERHPQLTGPQIFT